MNGSTRLLPENHKWAHGAVNEPDRMFLILLPQSNFIDR
jgi:hypothetical protein